MSPTTCNDSPIQPTIEASHDVGYRNKTLWVSLSGFTVLFPSFLVLIFIPIRARNSQWIHSNDWNQTFIPINHVHMNGIGIRARFLTDMGIIPIFS